MIFKQLKRKYRLTEIRKVRALKDEAMLCDNKGRLKKIIMSFPDVEGYNYHYNAFDSDIKVTMFSGHEYSEYGDYCLQKIIVELYLLWVIKTLNR